MKIKMTTAFLAILILSAPFAFGEDHVQNSNVSRVVNVCGDKISEVNISALEEAAKVLKGSRPDLAGELQKIAQSSVS